MTAIAVSPVTARPTGSAFWFTAVALVAAALALTVWVVTTGASHAGNVTPGNRADVSTGQHANQLCAPAPGTRYC